MLLLVPLGIGVRAVVLIGRTFRACLIRPICLLEELDSGTPNRRLFYGHTLGEIPRLVDVATALDGGVIGDEL